MVDVSALKPIVEQPSIFYILLLVVVIVCIENMSQYFLKNYTIDKKLHFFIYGVILYAIIAYILTLTFKYEKMVIVNILWGGVSALLLTAMAYVLFDEKLTIREIIGILVIFAGIFIVNWK